MRRAWSCSMVRVSMWELRADTCMCSLKVRWCRVLDARKGGKFSRIKPAELSGSMKVCLLICLHVCLPAGLCRCNRTLPTGADLSNSISCSCRDVSCAAVECIGIQGAIVHRDVKFIKFHPILSYSKQRITVSVRRGPWLWYRNRRHISNPLKEQVQRN